MQLITFRSRPSQHSLAYRVRGGSRGGAWGAHAPPFGTEQALNVEVYRALSARSYSDTAHISTASCPANIKHSNLRSVGQFCGSVSHTMADSEGKGAPRNDHTMNHQSYSPVVKHFAWLWRSPTVSEALSYGLNLKIFLGEHAPRLS